jgi:two-component system, cell cycle sensor histidine kinase and response regulator CckA
VPARAIPDDPFAFLTSILDAAPYGILILDASGRVVAWNPQLIELLGLAAAPLDLESLESVTEIIDAQLDGALPAASTAAILAGDPGVSRQDLVRLKDGRLVERALAPQRIGERVVGRVLTYRDLTSSLRAAEALDEDRAVLEQAQRVAHTGSWVSELDGSGRLRWSVETHRIFDLTPAEFEGTTAAFYGFVHPGDRDLVRAAAREAIDTGRPYDIEHRIVRRDGTVRWLHERASITRDAQGRALRMIGTAQDITDRRLLEEQLRQSQKMEAIGRLAGGIAHDLNNALTAIAGYAELALGELANEHTARADVEEIRRAAERAGSVTRQLLTFSRKQLIEPRVFDLNDTVTSLARLLARLLGTDVRVQTRLASAPLPVLGDPGQMEQAIINLAVNARDAMPVGGQLTLTTGLETVDDDFARTHGPITPGRYVVLRVTDTGHGMSPDTKARIFEPFFTTKEPGKGTGLGLSMVYGTVKQSGGFVFADSEVDRGTTIRLYLPPAPSEPHAREAAPPREERPRGHETLLIVEDEPTVRNLVASALRNDGYQLLLAGSADEAIAIAAAHEGPIDLLLTDAIMPGKSGIDLAAVMAARRPGMPVIIMSGYTEDALSLGSLGGPVALLQKPFTPRALRRRIREVLDE